MRTGIVRALLTATIAVSAVTAACSYAPNPESGTLMCGPASSCPENYSCVNQYCWRDGDISGSGGSAGSAGSGVGGRGGSGGTGGSGDPKAKFIGRWNFVAPAQRVRVCPGVNETVPLPVDAADFITIEAGTVSPLSAFYYCDWNVDLNAAGTATVIRPGQTCSAVDTSQVPPYTFTWTGESFTLTTTDGRSGTIQASIPYAYTSTASTGSCTATFSGPVMKN